jgi:superfamily II DNA or RNA helicase
MSLIVPIHQIEEKIRNRIYRTLKVKEKVDPKALYRRVKEVYPYRIENDLIFLPFQWAYSQDIFKSYRKKREELPLSKTTFIGNLREEQLVIQKEAIQYLNQQGSIVIAVYPGGGKTITSLSMCSKIGTDSFHSMVKWGFTNL